MWLSDTSIKQPVFITMVVAAIIVLGAISYTRLPVDLYPDISVPVVVVRTLYPGAGPEDMESLVSKPIEEALGSLNGVDTVRSTSSESLSLVVVGFRMEYPARRAADDVRERLASIRDSLPRDIREPVVLRFDPAMLPILTFGIAARDASRGPEELRRLAEDTIKPRLERLEGVAGVEVSGGLEREAQVELSLDRLLAYRVAVPQVVAAIKAENLSLPAGRLSEGQQELLLRTSGEFKGLDEIGSVIVGGPPGLPVYLRDVATIKEGFKEVRSLTRLDGRESVVLSLRKQSGSNTIEVAERARREMKRLLQDYPDLEIAVGFDQSTYIRQVTDATMENLILGGILATLVVFFFFRDVRNTLVTVIGLPMIVIGTFGVLYFMKFSLNMITLMALSLSIGMLIDDAIVVRENIFRHMERGSHPREAASQGTAQIALAVMATTFTIVAVFFPIAFATGLVGIFLRDFGWTVSVAVLISLFEAFTLAPMLSAYFFRPMQEEPERRGVRGFLEGWGDLYRYLDRGYRRLLGWALGHRWQVVSVGLLAFLASLVVLPFMTRAFVTPFDRGEFEISLELPPGAALSETDRMARRAEEILFQQPEVAHVFTTVGVEEGGGERASLYVQLKRKGETPAFQQRMRGLMEGLGKLAFTSEETANMPGATTAVASAVLGRPVQINIRGSSFQELDRASQQTLDLLRDVPGIVDLDRSVKPGKPELRLEVDRARASDLGISTALVGTSLRTLVNGEVASKLRRGGEELDILVRLRPEDRSRAEDILSLTLPSPKGGFVPLGSITKLRSATSPSQIERENMERQVVVGANYYGRPLEQVQREAATRLRELRLPPGYSFRFAGQAELQEESFSSLTFSLGLSVIFIYMVLASQFGSFVHPFTIMLALPLAVVGGLSALLLTGKNLDVVSMIGVILLMGLVTKNAILLVDFTNRLRREGLERNEAILTAGPIRLRPILMTTLAMIFGMLPIALGLGAGSEMRAPMGITVIGGLVTSTLLTLVVVPVVYTLLDDLGRRIRGKGP